MERRLRVDERGQPGRLREGLRAGHRGGQVAQDHRVLRRHHPPHEEHRDAVQHDRGDHLVGAGLGLQHAGDAAPERATQDAGEGHQQRARAAPGTSAIHENVPTHAAAVAPTRSWPSAPMLNRPARNANATASDGADERRGPAEGRVDAIGRAEHAVEQRRVGLEGVAADQQDDDGRDGEGEEHGVQRDQQRTARSRCGAPRVPRSRRRGRLRVGGRVGHQATASGPWPLAMYRPMVSRVTSSRSNGPTRSPR